MFFENLPGLPLIEKRTKFIPKGIKMLSAKEELKIPLIGAPAAALRLVKEGEQVHRGQPLSAPHREAIAFSPVTGLVHAITSLQHPVLGEIFCANIIPKEDQKVHTKQGCSLDETDLSAVAEHAGIIDELDGIPLFRKWKKMRRKNVSVLVLDLMEEDPYLCSGMMCFQEYAGAVMEGLRLSAKACGVDEVRIAILKREKPDWKDFESSDLLLFCEDRYPAWNIMKKEFEQKGKIIDRIGPQACMALWNAVKTGRPQTYTVITVAGNAVESPGNFCVPVGISVKEVLKICGVKPEAHVIMGPLMTGVEVNDWDIPIYLSTRCLIAEKSYPERKEFACIGCQRCAKVCVEKISPWYLCQYLKQEQHPEPTELPRAEFCNGCNACTAICPAGIHLADLVKYAAAIKEKGELP